MGADDDVDDSDDEDWMYHDICCSINYRDERTIKKTTQRARVMRVLL